MLSLTAFNPFAEALRQSCYTLAVRDRAALARVSSDLVQLYEGNQRPYLEAWLRTHTKDPEILTGYLRLAATQNVTKMVVDRVSSVSLVRPVWVDRETGEIDHVGQANWERLIEEWLSNDWDAWTQEVDHRTNLLKVLTASVAWDDLHQEIVLSAYGPHEIDVTYCEGNTNKLRPDSFVFLREEATGWEEEWYFGPDAPGTRRISGEDAEQDAFPVLDSRTGLPLVPFVRFATREGTDFFAWDNQDYIISAQEFVNRIWTRISVLTEMAVNKSVLLKGDGWADQEGRMRALMLDIFKPIRQPSPDHGQDPSKDLISFVGPSVQAEIDALLGLSDNAVELLAALNGVNAAAVRSKSEARSGYALQIESSSLVKKHNDDTKRLAPAWRRLVSIIRAYWNHHCPKTEWKIPETSVPSVVMPQSHAIVTTREAVDSDLALVNGGMKRPLPVIFNAEPGIPAVTAFRMAAEVQARISGGEVLHDSVASVGARQGVTRSSEVVSLSDQSALPMPAPGGAPAASPPTGEPTAPVPPRIPPTPESGPVAAQEPSVFPETVLEGEQIDSLREVIESVVEGEIPAASAIALIRLAVPSITEQQVRSLIDPTTGFKPSDEPNPSTKQPQPGAVPGFASPGAVLPANGAPAVPGAE